MAYMNRAPLPLNNRISLHGVPVMYIIYILFILISPFAGVTLLFLISVLLFLGTRFSENYVSHSRDVISLYFSLSLMLLFSIVMGGSAYSYPFYIALAAFAIAIVGNHNSFFSETSQLSDFESRRSRLKKKSFSIMWGSVFLGIRIAAAFIAAGWVVFWQNLSISYNLVFFIAVIGAVTGSLFESIPSKNR